MTSSKYQYAVEIKGQEVPRWIQVWSGTREEAETFAASRRIKRHHPAAIRIVDRMAV